MRIHGRCRAHVQGQPVRSCLQESKWAGLAAKNSKVPSMCWQQLAICALPYMGISKSAIIAHGLDWRMSSDFECDLV